MSQKFENILNLALETPEEIRGKTNNLNVGFETATRQWEVIVKYHDSLSFLVDYGILVEELIAGYAILTVPEELVELLSEIEQIEYVEKPKRYFFDAELPSENVCVYPISLSVPKLQGEGTLIAILDSGIDYSRQEFRRLDGSTRIVALWDQSLSGTTYTQGASQAPVGFTIGIEFAEEQINKALEVGGEEGFLLVPSRDVSGHGTAVAGIAAASRVNILGDGVYQGIAPEAELLIVKLGTPREGGFPKTTEIMRAVTYAVRKGIELQKPLVINLSFGNTYGSHDGSSLLERFLDNASEIGRTVICVGAGNEGDSAGHFAGDINTRQVVEINVGEYETTLNVQLWSGYSDIYDVILQAPNGTKIRLSGGVNKGKQEQVLGRTLVLVYKGEPKPYSVLQETYFDFVPAGGSNFIDTGVWQLQLEPVRVVTGRYDVYLPSVQARNGRTGILRPTPEMTLTIPSTSTKIVTVGAYDTEFDQYASFSGRGNMRISRDSSIVVAGQIKPDIVAPGVGIIAPDIYGGYATFTGTSFATPIVSGSAALLMEWGIIQENDIYLYGEKIKAYLRRGAGRLRGENVYPNERVGFGKICVADSLPLSF